MSGGIGLGGCAQLESDGNTIPAPMPLRTCLREVAAACLSVSLCWSTGVLIRAVFAFNGNPALSRCTGDEKALADELTHSGYPMREFKPANRNWVFMRFTPQNGQSP